MAEEQQLEPTVLARRAKVAGAIIGFGLLFCLVFDPSKAFIDWRAYPGIRFTPKAHLEFASWGLVWKVRLLDLVCTAEGDVRIVYRARLPGPDVDAPQGPFKAGLFVAGIGYDSTMSAELVAAGRIDTIVTAPLSDAQLHRLIHWAGRPHFDRISFYGLETITRFRATASQSAIETFVQDCKGSAS